ncbi:hypothetical protein ACFPTO_04815 [Paraburkholderia denitrificans]|uniref:Uncharacterized protein n=1 Tax=Paraburkholderia denitrificans TaxID=694025 RepID=A0ABW0J507_9BURK
MAGFIKPATSAVSRRERLLAQASPAIGAFGSGDALLIVEIDRERYVIVLADRILEAGMAIVIVLAVRRPDASHEFGLREARLDSSDNFLGFDARARGEGEKRSHRGGTGKMLAQFDSSKKSGASRI